MDQIKNKEKFLTDLVDELNTKIKEKEDYVKGYISKEEDKLMDKVKELE